MSSQLKNWTSNNSGDLAMVYMMMIAGLNFVVLRDAVSGFSPLVFNALRFALASCVMIPILIYRIPRMEFTRRELLHFIFFSAIAMSFFQIILVNSVQFTSASNASLMMATGPAWTVLLTVFLGRLRFNRYLLLGLMIMFFGTSMVILSGGDGVTFSMQDLIGCAMMLVGTVVSAGFVVYIQPIVDRRNSVDLAIIRHTTVSLSIIFLAIPQLIHIRPSDIPVSLLPNIIFAGLIASISGTITTTFAQRKIGATRMKVYDNLMPIAATLFAFLLLGEPLTLWQVVGGAFTLTGVMLVRRFAKNIPATGLKSHQVVPATVPAKQVG